MSMVFVDQFKCNFLFVDNMKKNSFWILLFCLFSSTSYAQFEEVEVVDEDYEEINRVQLFELSFSTYFPLDAFKQKLDRSSLYGFSLAYLVQLQKEKPAFVGVEVFHKNLGLFTKNYDALVGNEQLVLTGKVASNALGINTVYRYYPPLKLSFVEPYVEGQFGLKYLYSYLSETGAFSDDEPYDNFDILKGDWVLAYGGAFGFQLRISDIYFINLKSTYHFAVSGEYQKKLKDNLTNIDFPNEAFELVQSTTNVIKLDIGFTLLF